MNENNFTDETLPIPGMEAPVASVDESGWSERAVGSSKIVMHMPGSKMFDGFDCLSNIDPREFKPESQTYTVMPHIELVQEVLYAVDRYLSPAGIEVTNKLCVLGKGRSNVEKATKLGAKMFGLIGLSKMHNENDEDGMQCVIGLQNAIDGSGKAQVCVGNRVFICDNLAFSGDMTVSHRHSKNIVNAMFAKIHGIIKTTIERFDRDVELSNRLKASDCNYADGVRLLTELAAVDAFDNMKQFNAAVKQLRYPQFSVFANDSSLWSVYNAATWGVGVSTSPLGVIDSTSIISNFFREKVGLQAVEV